MSNVLGSVLCVSLFLLLYCVKLLLLCFLVFYYYQHQNATSMEKEKRKKIILLSIASRKIEHEDRQQANSISLKVLISCNLCDLDKCFYFHSIVFKFHNFL